MASTDAAGRHERRSGLKPLRSGSGVSRPEPARRRVDDLARWVRGPRWFGLRQPAAPLVTPVTVNVARAKHLEIPCKDVLDRVREGVPTQRAANLIPINVGVPSRQASQLYLPATGMWIGAWRRSGSVRWLALTRYAPCRKIAQSQPDGPVDAWPELGRPRGDVERVRGAQVMRVGRRRSPGQ